MEGQRVGKYLIVAKIGSGAMGEVYRAHDAILNRNVAVKTMAEIYAADEQLVERFRREAQSAARLNHPNIVTVYDFGEEQGRFYLAMELLEGTDLKELIAARALSDLWDQLDVMEQIAEGVAYAHRQGVVHRDLKPANIRVLPNGRVKVMDFGLARIGTSEMTRAGTVMGTPNYMSPEQVKGTSADARSDIAPITLPPVAAPELTPNTLPPPPALSATSEPAIRKVIADYGRAIESKDIALFKAVKPNLTADEEKRLQESFKTIKSQQVAITVDSVQIDGAQATVKVTRQDTINGRSVQPIQQVFRLGQATGSWAIQAIGIQ